MLILLTFFGEIRKEFEESRVWSIYRHLAAKRKNIAGIQSMARARLFVYLLF